MLPYHPHILLIAGTGRNSGKTSLACRIIERFSDTLKIVALKISPHLHQEPQTLDVLINKASHVLFRESGSNPKKDSARMLSAGAAISYYMEVTDRHLPDAIREFFEIQPGPAPVIIESPALIQYVIPGVFIIVDNPRTTVKKNDILQMKEKADWYIGNGSAIPSTILQSLRYGKAGWWIDSNDH